MATHHNHAFMDSPTTKVSLNKRLEDSGWGFFLLLIGTLLLLPSGFVHQGAWLIGAGLIMLALNGIRYFNNIIVSRFTVVLGFVAVSIGLASFFGLRPPLFALILVVVGLSIVARSLVPTKDRQTH